MQKQGAAPWGKTAARPYSKTLVGVAVLVLAAMPGIGGATCSFTVGTTGNITVAVPATIAVPRNAAIGSTIFTSRNYLPTAQTSFTCSGDLWGVVNSVGPQPGVSATLYPLGDSGVSWQWTYNTGRGTVEPLESFGSNFISQSTGLGGTAYSLRFVVSGPINSGSSVSAGVLGRWVFGSLTALNMVLGNAIVIVPQSCSTSSVPVDLGMRKTSEFKGVGSRASSKDFSIPLNACPGGLNSIKYRIDAVTTVVNSADSVISLDSASTAKGIGIQLQDSSGNALPLGKDLSFTSYAGEGNYNIPLRAAYYQTQAPVVPGSANGSVQFTLTYQ